MQLIKSTDVNLLNYITHNHNKGECLSAHILVLSLYDFLLVVNQELIGFISFLQNGLNASEEQHIWSCIDAHIWS